MENNLASQAIAKKNRFIGEDSIVISDRAIGGNNKYRIYWYNPEGKNRIARNKNRRDLKYGCGKNRNF